MKISFIKPIILFIFIIIITIYSKNKELIKFNNIALNHSSIINEESLFNYINYNLDSMSFYSKNDITIKIKSRYYMRINPENYYIFYKRKLKKDSKKDFMISLLKLL